MADAGKTSPGRKAQPPRVLTLCDDVGALMRLAAWTVHLPAGSQRTDLPLSAALDHLRDSTLPDYDLVVLAPSGSDEPARRALLAVLERAAEKSAAQIVLMPLRAQPLQISRPGLRVLYGPPFTGSDPVSGVEVAAFPDEADAPRGGRLPFALFRRRSAAAAAAGAPDPAPVETPPHVIAVQPLCGGVGATTVAVSLARALAKAGEGLTVCLMDLDLQFGGVGSYFDLPASAGSLELFRAPSSLEPETFRAGLHSGGPRLELFAAPAELIPLDAISGADVAHLVRLARERADIVVLDLPFAISDWTEEALRLADQTFGVAALDIRAVRNLARMKRLLGPALFAPPLFRPLLNRAPRRPGREWLLNFDSFGKGLGAGECLRLADGGADILRASDSGSDPAAFEPGNPFLADIRSLAAGLLARMPARHPGWTHEAAE